MSNGIETVQSHHTFDRTVNRLLAAFHEKGIKLFATIDHSGEAAAAGLHMPPTKVLIFGSPKAGTPLMLAAPSTAIDLPLKILVAEDLDGKVSLSWNSSDWLQQRHNFPAELTANIGAASALAQAAATE